MLDFDQQRAAAAVGTDPTWLEPEGALKDNFWQHARPLGRMFDRATLTVSGGGIRYPCPTRRPTLRSAGLRDQRGPVPPSAPQLAPVRSAYVSDRSGRRRRADAL